MFDSLDFISILLSETCLVRKHEKHWQSHCVNTCNFTTEIYTTCSPKKIYFLILKAYSYIFLQQFEVLVSKSTGIWPPLFLFSKSFKYLFLGIIFQTFNESLCQMFQVMVKVSHDFVIKNNMKYPCSSHCISTLMCDWFVSALQSFSRGLCRHGDSGIWELGQPCCPWMTLPHCRCSVRRHTHIDTHADQI